MSTKPQTKPEDAAAAPEAPEAFPLTLDEFCAQLSSEDRRVELIGGFHATERAAGRTKDLASAFKARFDEFVVRPA